MWNPLKKKLLPSDPRNILAQTITELVLNGHHADAIRRITAELRMVMNRFEREQEVQALKRLTELTEELERLLVH